MQDPHSVLAESLSGCPSGTPIVVTNTTQATAHAVHVMTDDAAQDRLYFHLNNIGTARVEARIILAPITGGAADLTAAELAIQVPPGTVMPVLQNEVVRRIAAAPYSLAVYVLSGELRAWGWFNRFNIGQVVA